MKILIISTTLILFTFCLYGQMNFSVGLGPQYNFGTISPKDEIENSYNFTYFGKGKVYYSANKMAYHFSAQWNRTEWNYRTLGIVSGINYFQYRTDYLNLNPSIELKPISFLGMNAGGYFGFGIAEATYEQASERWINASGFKVNSPIDYGLSFGINGYFAQKISIELMYNLGLKNLREDSDITFTDDDGNAINTNSKNRTIQLSFNYHFNEF